MKKKSKSNLVIIAVILLVALFFSVYSLILNVKKTYAYSYSNYQTTYEYNVNASNVTLYSTLLDGEEFVDGYGPRDLTLNYGRNNIVVKTKNKDDIKDFTMLINRADDRSSEDRLKSLYVSNGKIDFKPDKNTYNMNVGKNIDEIAINGTLMSNKARYEYGYEPRKIKLSEGLNVAFIKVKSEAGTERSYKINIFKGNSETKLDNDSNKLNSLSLSEGILNFKPDTNEYNIDVSNDVENVDVYAFAESNSAKVEVNKNNDLKIGKNDITIKVTNSNLENIYTIHINRKEKKSTNCNLKMLNINGFKLNFKSNTYNYNLNLENKQNLIITAYPSDEDCKITILNNEEKNKNTIKVLVANDNNAKTYTIQVTKHYFTMFNEICAVAFTFIFGLFVLSILKYYELKQQKLKKAKKKTKKSNQKRKTTKKNK